jgi:hypothetical protein
MHTVADYPPRIPAEIPRDRVLVHNHVLRARRQGTRGFRLWLQALDTRVERCELRLGPGARRSLPRLQTVGSA